MDGGAWEAAVHGVAKSRTQLSDFNFTFHFHALEKEVATHSRVLAWRIPGTGEPGGLPSMVSHRVQKSTNNKCRRGCGEKGTLLTLLVGMQTSTATMENSVEIPLKTGNQSAV